MVGILAGSPLDVPANRLVPKSEKLLGFYQCTYAKKIRADFSDITWTKPPAAGHPAGTPWRSEKLFSDARKITSRFPSLLGAWRMSNKNFR